MTRTEARREAQRAIASLIRVHLEFSDNDLTSVCENWPEADQKRYLESCSDIANHLARYGTP